VRATHVAQLVQPPPTTHLVNAGRWTAGGFRAKSRQRRARPPRWEHRTVQPSKHTISRWAAISGGART